MGVSHSARFLSENKEKQIGINLKETVRASPDRASCFLLLHFSRLSRHSERGEGYLGEVKMADGDHAPCPPADGRWPARRRPQRCRSHDKNVLQSGHRRHHRFNINDKMKSDLVPDEGVVGTCCKNCRSDGERWGPCRATALQCGKPGPVDATEIASPRLHFYKASHWDKKTRSLPKKTCIDG